MGDNLLMAHRFPSGNDPTRVLGRRFTAYVIDVAIIGIVGVILLSMAKHKVYSGAPANGCSDSLFQAELRARFGNDPTACSQFGSNVYVWARSAFLRAWLITGVFAFIDLVVVQAAAGASIGKLFTGLRVVDRSGQKADFLAMLGRWIFLAIDAGTFVIGLISTLVSHPHRRIGDFVCGTYVVATHSVGEPVGVVAPGQRVVTPGSAASWPPAVVIPTVPTPAPTSLWAPSHAPPPVAPSPQWGSPPVPTPSATPPPPQPSPHPPAPGPEAVPAGGHIHPPAIPAPWATPPEPQSVPVSPSAPAPAPAPPARAPAPAPAAGPERRPGPTLESEPAAIRVTPPPAAAPPRPARAPRPKPPATPPQPSRTVESPRPEPQPPPSEKLPVAAPPRWTPVAPTAAPETVADEWFELALSSDVPDEEPDKL